MPVAVRNPHPQDQRDRDLKVLEARLLPWRETPHLTLRLLMFLAGISWYEMERRTEITRYRLAKLLQDGAPPRGNELDRIRSVLGTDHLAFTARRLRDVRRSA